MLLEELAALTVIATLTHCTDLQLLLKARVQLLAVPNTVIIYPIQALEP